MAKLFLVTLNLFSYVLVYKSIEQSQVLHSNQCLDNKETGRKVNARKSYWEACYPHMESIPITQNFTFWDLTLQEASLSTRSQHPWSTLHKLKDHNREQTTCQKLSAVRRWHHKAPYKPNVSQHMSKHCGKRYKGVSVEGVRSSPSHRSGMYSSGFP